MAAIRPANINSLGKEQKRLLIQDLTLFFTKICTSFFFFFVISEDVLSIISLSEKLKKELLGEWEQPDSSPGRQLRWADAVNRSL